MIYKKIRMLVKNTDAAPEVENCCCSVKNVTVLAQMNHILEMSHLTSKP